MECIASTLEGLEIIAEEELNGKKDSKGRVLFNKERKIIRSALFSYQLLKKFKFKKEEDIYKTQIDPKIKGTIRVDCKREGKHKFSSQDIRKSFGEKLFNQGFKVNLKEPENIIFIDIKDNNCFIGLNPVENSKRNYRIRNVSGSINSTIAYSLVHLAEIKREFFYQSKHVLNKKGLMVLLTRDSLIVKKFASEFEFKIINSLDFIQGDTKYSILKLKRS